MDSGGLGCAVWFCALSVVVVGGMPNARTSQSPRELDGFGSLRMAWHQPKPLFWCGKRTQNVCVLLYRPAASVVGWVFLSSVFFSLDFGMHIFRSRFFVDWSSSRMATFCWCSEAKGTLKYPVSASEGKAFTWWTGLSILAKGFMASVLKKSGMELLKAAPIKKVAASFRIRVLM